MVSSIDIHQSDNPSLSPTPPLLPVGTSFFIILLYECVVNVLLFIMCSKTTIFCMTYNATTSAVPAPPGLSPAISQSVDTLQDLITRKREADKNKFKYHLTEADCNLLCSHGTAGTFTAGQVLVEVGAPLTKVCFLFIFYYSY